NSSMGVEGVDLIHHVQEHNDRGTKYQDGDDQPNQIVRHFSPVSEKLSHPRPSPSRMTFTPPAPAKWDNVEPITVSSIDPSGPAPAARRWKRIEPERIFDAEADVSFGWSNVNWLPAGEKLLHGTDPVSTSDWASEIRNSPRL